MLSNQQVAEVFQSIADSMELLGEDRFKTQAYRRAAETLRALPRGLQDYHARGVLEEIPGVGSAISSKIAEILDTGSLQFYERLRARVPDGVVDVMRVPGVGPKTAWRLHQELGISSLESLAAAAGAGEIRKLKGLGQKVEQRILAGLARASEASGPDRYLLGEAVPLTRDLLAALRAALPDPAAISAAGSVRRSCPTVGDVDLVACAADPGPVLDACAGLPHVATVERRAERRLDLRMHNGMDCSLLVAVPEAFGAALVMWTGSSAHRERLVRRAAEHGLLLAEDGLWRDGELVRTEAEADVYRALGLPFVAPELREDWGEIEAAESGKLPDLLSSGDIRADLHSHTQWSDGNMALREAAELAIARGYHYYAITDHSLYMGMVNGLDAARLKAQRAEIDAINEDLRRRSIDFRLLQGSEVDILPDGTLALPDDVLATLDWVVASPHINLRQDRETFTARILKAIHNPHVDCIGHPTGRLLLRREPADLDVEAVLQAAAETGTVLEIDGSPYRLDLDAQYVKRALDLGIKVAVDSDAHAAAELDGMYYGVLTARRGWATRAGVVNAWSWEEIEEHKVRKAERTG